MTFSLFWLFFGLFDCEITVKLLNAKIKLEKQAEETAREPRAEAHGGEKRACVELLYEKLQLHGLDLVENGNVLIVEENDGFFSLFRT